MTASPEAPRPSAGSIEGGFDAVVVGASLDGLAAAALLGKAGFKTVLLGAGDAAVDPEPREFAPGYWVNDGEHLLTHLDPELAGALELYRHGLSFASRRLETLYYFGDGAALLVDGDPYRSREAVAAMAETDAAGYAAFLETALDASRGLRPLFEGGVAPELTAPLSSVSEHFLSSSAADVVDAAFDSTHLKDMLMAEALFRWGARPDSPFGFAALLRRFAGEAAGLQGAVACAKGGAAGVLKALRRAAQAAQVEFRPATSVRSVLVEWDRIAGVATRDGGQIRAPIVVNALPAHQAFTELIGPSLLNIEFQAGLSRPAPEYASARICFAMKDVPGDERTEANLARRLFYAPSRDDLNRAFNAARRGEVAAPLMLEAVFPSAFEAGLAPEGCHVVSTIAHPVPFNEAPDEALADAVGAAARETFEKMAPGAGARLVATDVRLAADEAASAGFPAESRAAQAGVLSAWARAQRLETASGIAGYFFCGPEAQVGPGLSGAAARRAARRATRYLKERAAA